jgi:hypothetical protein
MKEKLSKMATDKAKADVSIYTLYLACFC